MNRRLSPAANEKLREASREISGVNETVASGLSLPLARPWLIIIPILMDVFLWMGIQIPITRITEPLADVMTDQGGENGDLAAEQLGLLGETTRINDVIGSMIPSVFSGLSRENLFSVVTSLFAPGLTSGVDRSELPSIWTELGMGFRDPGGIVGVLGLSMLFLVIASLIAVCWRVPLALIIVRKELSPGPLVVYILKSWMRFLAFIGLIFAAACVVLIPLLLVAGFLLVLGLNLAALVALFLVMVASLVAIYARFVLASIILDDIGPLSALKRSALITQAFFGPTVRFSVAAVLLATGALRLWDVMIFSPPGLPVAILVNSFLGTGLAVATMMFYHDRNLLLKKFSPPPNAATVSQTPL